jgi:RNA polymerase sigma-70 factor (ECF subfamily)
MQIATHTVPSLSTNTLQTRKNSEEQLLLKRFSQGESSAFWELWLQYRDYLYYRCLRWMGDNYNDAEDALSWAMLKAENKLPKDAEKITNPRAWFTRLTRNLCVDIHRKRSRSQMTSVEEIFGGEDEMFVSNVDSPDSTILRYELRLYIANAVNILSDELRIPFILRYFHENSCEDIAQQLRLTVNNVHKRIQHARKILKRRLSRYLSGLDDFGLYFSDSSCEDASYMIIDSLFDERMVWNSKEAMTMASVGETISYQVSATCLEIPQSWYHSHNLVGWS